MTPKTDIIKVVLIIPSLRAGGAERVMSFLASHLDPQRFQVTLLVTGGSADQVYEVNCERIIFFNRKKVRFAFPDLVKFLITNKPDIVMGSIGHLNNLLAILAIFFSKTKFIARETAVTGSSFYGKISLTQRFWVQLKKFSLAKTVCQSQDMKEDLLSNYGYKEKMLKVINNPVSSAFKPKSLQDGQQREIVKLITIGRLAKPKGYTRIIEALSKLPVPFQYTYIGSGPEADHIDRLITKLGLNQKVKHIAYTSEIPKLLRESDIYLQGSYVEGFPNALLESCASGTPVVAFAAPGGINEIIQEGINGFIVKDEESFNKAIQTIIHTGPWDPAKISESVLSRYNEKFIISEYERLFIELSA